MIATMFLTFIILVVGLKIINEVCEVKRILAQKESQDICRYLNDKEVYIRDAKCNTLDFYAHVVRKQYSEHDCIVIDIKEIDCGTC